MRAPAGVMRFAGAVMIGLSTLAVSSQSAIASDQCMTSKEMRSERVRALQSMLMFAALKCIHKPHLETEDNYNAIMRRHSKDLAAHSYIVQDYFRRTHGAAHRQRLHKYTTRMANQYSINSFSDKKFCEKAAVLGAKILNAEYDVIINARFDKTLLLPSFTQTCKLEDPSKALMNTKVPDLVSIHMPDLDTRLRQQFAEDQY